MLGPHTDRDNPLSRIMCAPIAPPVTVSHTMKIWLLFCFSWRKRRRKRQNVFWTWQMIEKLPRVVLGVRKTTTPDEELKIIVFSPAFVLHYINEVLRLVSLGHLKYVHTGAYHSWLRTCGALTHTLSTRGRRRLTQRFPTHIISDSPASHCPLNSSSGKKITCGKRQKHFKPRLTGKKVQPRRMTIGTTLTRQWEKVEVMKRKTGNLRTTMRMGRGVELLPNDQE